MRRRKVDIPEAGWHCQHVVSTSVYSWLDLRFALPAGLRDDTLLTLRSDDGAVSVTLTRDVTSSGGDAFSYAVAQEQALKAKKLKGYEGGAPTRAKIGSHAVVVV